MAHRSLARGSFADYFPAGSFPLFQRPTVTWDRSSASGRVGRDSNVAMSGPSSVQRPDAIEPSENSTIAGSSSSVTVARAPGKACVWLMAMRTRTKRPHAH